VDVVETEVDVVETEVDVVETEVDVVETEVDAVELIEIEIARNARSKEASTASSVSSAI